MVLWCPIAQAAPADLAKTVLATFFPETQTTESAVSSEQSAQWLFLNGINAQEERVNKLAKDFEQFIAEENADIAAVGSAKKNTDELLSARIETGPFAHYADLWAARGATLKGIVQALVAREELWKLFERVYRDHITRSQRRIAQLRNLEGQTSRVLGTLQELHEVEGAILSQNEEQNLLSAAIKNLKQQILAEQDLYVVLKQSLDLTNKEKLRLEVTWGNIDSAMAESHDKASVAQAQLALAALDKKLAEEKMALVELRIRKFKFELMAEEGELALGEVRQRRLAEVAHQIKSILKIDAQDVRIAKIRWQDQVKITSQEKESAVRAGNKLREERAMLEGEMGYVSGQLNELKSRSANPGSEAYLLANIWYLKYRIDTIEQELTLLNLKSDLVEIENEKESLNYRTLDVRFKLRNEGVDLSKFVEELEAQKNRLLTARELLRNERDETIRNIARSNAKSEAAKSKIQELTARRSELFAGPNDARFQEAIAWLETVRDARRGLVLSSEYLSYVSKLEFGQSQVLGQITPLISEFVALQREVDIWRRSPSAISIEQAWGALWGAGAFCRKLFWGTPDHLAPAALMGLAKGVSLLWVFGLLLYLLLGFVLFIGVRRLVALLQQKVTCQISLQHGRNGLLWLLFFSAVIDFICDYFPYLFAWTFVNASISIPIKIFSFSLASFPAYFLALFYLASIPLFILFSQKLLAEIGVLNQRLSYFFFNESSQGRSTTLLSYVLYTWSVVYPLCKAFKLYGPPGTHFVAVLYAAFSLIVLGVLLLFVDKEDVLSLIPSRGWLLAWIRQRIEDYYYPVFLFCMSLLIMSNPYIGYLNLAWYLAFVTPFTVLGIIGLFKAHSLLRQYSLAFFIKEEDGGTIDRFDHAKMLYAFFIALTFLGSLMIGFVALSWMWGSPHTVKGLWHSLSNEWVLPIGGGKFGAIQVVIFAFFFGGGFITSSLANKVLFDRFLDVFKVDPGAQNTFFRISKYVIIFLFTMMGLVAVNLGSYIPAAILTLSFAFSFSVKDQLADIFAGLLLLLERQIEIGHFIQLDNDTRGTVHLISLRSTTIRTARNIFVVVPNRRLISNTILNWGAGRVPIGMEIDIRVAYGSNIELVRQIINDVLNEHPLILRIPATSIRLEEFGDFDLQFLVRAFINARKVREMWSIASDVRIALYKAFEEHKVEIPFPQQVVQLASRHNNNAVNIKIDGKDSV